MIAVARALHAETLKLKRTLALRMVFVAPALVVVLAVFVMVSQASRSGADAAGRMPMMFYRQSLAIWAIFMMPLLITLETALLCGMEHGERQWKQMFALPMPRTAIYLSKYLTAHGLTAASTAFLWLLISLAGWGLTRLHPALTAAAPPALAELATQAAYAWLAAGIVQSANLWIALRWPSFTVSLGAGIAGTFFALFAASAKAGMYYPWLLPVNAVSSPERLTVALSLGIGGGLLLAVCGCVDFVRREESAPPGLSRAAICVWAVLLVILAVQAVLVQKS